MSLSFYASVKSNKLPYFQNTKNTLEPCILSQKKVKEICTSGSWTENRNSNQFSSSRWRSSHVNIGDIRKPYGPQRWTLFRRNSWVIAQTFRRDRRRCCMCDSERKLAGCERPTIQFSLTYTNYNADISINIANFETSTSPSNIFGVSMQNGENS